MSAEENTRVVRRWVEEVMSQGRIEAIDEVLAEAVRFGGGPETRPTPDARRRVRAYITAYRVAFPDLTVDIDDIVPAEDAVTLCWTSRGTHLGHFSHPDVQSFGLAPTGRAARWSGISLFRLRDGRIVETRSHGDVYGLLRQLGLLPAPGPPGPGA
jgi:predicted ester cyclase